MNSAIFTGRMTKDAVIKETSARMPDGTPVKATNCTIAVNKTRRGQQTTTYVQFALWRGQAEALTPYLKKGKRVSIRGDVYPRSYTNSQGQPGICLVIGTLDEIELLDDARGTQPDELPPIDLEDGDVVVDA